MWCYKGELFYRSMLCKWTTSLISKFYKAHLPMRTKFDANIGCDMSLKWSHVRQNVAELVFSIWNTHKTSWSAPHNHMLSPNLATLGTRIKHVITRWIAFLNMNDGGCSLIYVKVTNPNFIKEVAKSPCITHPPN